MHTGNVQVLRCRLPLAAERRLISCGLLAKQPRELGALVSQLPLQGCPAKCLLPAPCRVV